VRDAMEKVLSSPQFCNSRRYPALLRYVVDKTLSGHGDQIKERTVGVEVFGRVPNYDTNSDTVVRYTAGEVRKRLALYYHDADNEPIHILLSARSYLPEFHRVSEEEGSGLRSGSSLFLNPKPRRDIADSSVPSVLRMRNKKLIIWIACMLFGVSSAIATRWAWKQHHDQAMHRFWSPITQAKGPVLISPGGVIFSRTSTIGTEVANSPLESSYLSFENGLAMGRVAALLNSRGADYKIESANETTLEQIRESPVVLVGAYNNLWAQRLLLPLRFHFNIKPGEAILDSWHPEKRWTRDTTKNFGDTPDYAIVARFRNPSTDSMVVVVAGLQRYGTDAASQFVVSPRLLDIFNKQIGWNWTDKNVEVVLRVDVVNGKAGVPIIEATHVW